MGTSASYFSPVNGRFLVAGSTLVGAGTASAGGYLQAGYALNLYNAHVRVNAAGTGNNAALIGYRVSGTSTTTLGTITAGTNAINAALALTTVGSATAGATATALAAGDVVYFIPTADDTLSANITWEVGNAADAILT